MTKTETGGLMLLELMLAGALAALAGPPLPARGCDDPATRKAVLAPGTDAVTLFVELKRQEEANGLRTETLLDRLADRGKLSREQRGDAGLKMFADPAFKAAYEEFRKLSIAMMTKFELITEGDTVANCRIVIDLADAMPEILAVHDRQWKAMRAVLEAEARRLGISLAN